MNVTQQHPDLAASPERRQRFRWRFALLCIVLLGFGVIATGHFLLTHLTDLVGAERGAAESLASAPADDPSIETLRRAVIDASANRLRGLGRLAGFLAALAVAGTYLALLRRRIRNVVEVTNAATLMLILMGVALLASRLLVQSAIPDQVIWGGLLDLFVLHVIVCMIMPWTPRETALPFAPLLLVWAVTFLVPTPADLGLIDKVVIVIMSPIMLVPGMLLAQWRLVRRREEAERRFLGERVELFGGELSRARIVHDAMFPKPINGHVRFEYEYLPIAEIGGDYVHLHVCRDTECTTLTLLDVAGHGLAAALTVNRLFGELERILAEDERAEPAEIMSLLNRYINLTMARHSLYATGTCMRLDPSTGRLTWVNAGHPPCFLRHPNGNVAEMSTTALILGALDSDVFDPGQRETLLHPGDVVIAYTDGVFEARDERGKQFGLDRVRETTTFSPPPRSWPKFIAGAVTKHHGGHAEDDVLIATLTLESLRIDGAPMETHQAAAPIIEPVRTGAAMTPASGPHHE